MLPHITPPRTMIRNLRTMDFMESPRHLADLPIMTETCCDRRMSRRCYSSVRKPANWMSTNEVSSLGSRTGFQQRSRKGRPEDKMESLEGVYATGRRKIAK